VASQPPPVPTAALLPPGPQNAFEQGLAADKIRQLQAKLKLPATGTLDAATRAAVAAWQVKNKLPERNGSLGTASFARLMAS